MQKSIAKTCCSTAKQQELLTLTAEAYRPMHTGPWTKVTTCAAATQIDGYRPVSSSGQAPSRRRLES